MGKHELPLRLKGLPSAVPIHWSLQLLHHSCWPFLLLLALFPLTVTGQLEEQVVLVPSVSKTPSYGTKTISPGPTTLTETNGFNQSESISQTATDGIRTRTVTATVRYTTTESETSTRYGTLTLTENASSTHRKSITATESAGETRTESTTATQPTLTFSESSVQTLSNTPTRTGTDTMTAVTATRAASLSDSATSTSDGTVSDSIVLSRTLTRTLPPTPTPTAMPTSTETFSDTFSPTETSTGNVATATTSMTFNESMSLSATSAATFTTSPTITPPPTPTVTVSKTTTRDVTGSSTGTFTTGTTTVSIVPPNSPTTTWTITNIASESKSSTLTQTLTVTPPPTPSLTDFASATWTLTQKRLTGTVTVTNEMTMSRTDTFNVTQSGRSKTKGTASQSVWWTVTETETLTPPPTPSSTATPTVGTLTASATAGTFTEVLTSTETATKEPTFTSTDLASWSKHGATKSSTYTATATDTVTLTRLRETPTLTLTVQKFSKEQKLTTSSHILRLSGEEWKVYLTQPGTSANVVAAAKSRALVDIASALRLPLERVTILDVTHGSLVVYFTVARNASQVLLDSSINTILLNSVFPKLQQQLQVLAGNENIQVSALSTETVVPTSVAEQLCNERCFVAVICIGCVLLAALFCLVHCCCVKMPPTPPLTPRSNEANHEPLADRDPDARQQDPSAAAAAGSENGREQPPQQMQLLPEDGSGVSSPLPHLEAPAEGGGEVQTAPTTMDGHLSSGGNDAPTPAADPTPFSRSLGASDQAGTHATISGEGSGGAAAALVPKLNLKLVKGDSGAAGLPPRSPAPPPRAAHGGDGSSSGMPTVRSWGIADAELLPPLQSLRRSDSAERRSPSSTSAHLQLRPPSGTQAGRRRSRVGPPAATRRVTVGGRDAEEDDNVIAVVTVGDDGGGGGGSVADDVVAVVLDDPDDNPGGGWTGGGGDGEAGSLGGGVSFRIRRF